MRHLRAILLLLALSSSVAQAADVYVLQGYAAGPFVSGAAGQELIVWSTDVAFFNKLTTDADIRLVRVSNGGSQVGSPSIITVPAGRTASLSALGLDTKWRPSSTDTLWALQLQVPDGVLVDGALFMSAQSQQLPNPTFNPVVAKYGKIRLPVFTSLAAANEPQVTLATTLGDSAFIPSRIKVVIYNGGVGPASGRIEVRRHCDDAVVAMTNVSIPANTVAQFTGLPSYDTCGGVRSPLETAVYVVVTVDQPSFTVVSNVANNYNPVTSLTITSSQ